MKRSRKSPSPPSSGSKRLQRGLAAENAVLGLVDEAHAAPAEQCPQCGSRRLEPEAERLAHAAAGPCLAISTSCPMLTRVPLAAQARRAERCRNYVLEIVEGPEAGRHDSARPAARAGPRPGSRRRRCCRTSSVAAATFASRPSRDGARIEDLDSRNGTFVDGDQIYGPAHLARRGPAARRRHAPPAADRRRGARA